ncbi:MAG: hypothetical protein GY731_01325 [Gammaproteobacteria bacterium]|nr:hypothetical protein [Gammaproteobacteria bacterium]
MARIKLIVTGDMERRSHHHSLKRCFLNHRNGEQVEWDLPRRLNCATSNRLNAASKPSAPMQKLAQAMLDEALKGKRGDPADLVVVVDDVELGNLGREATVAQHFRNAVDQKLGQYATNTQDRYRQVLRRKCSFHLLKPMVESYLFGDENALRRAGVPAGVELRLVYPDDVERFETNDLSWLPECIQQNAMKKMINKSWWRHECHPKHYLEHLTERGSVLYDEMIHGQLALKDLEWPRVSKSVQGDSLIRCLFEDVADWFGVLNPMGGDALHGIFYPARHVHRDKLLLRNM